MSKAFVQGLRYVASILLWIVAFSGVAGFIGPIARGGGVDFFAAFVAVLFGVIASSVWPSEGAR